MPRTEALDVSFSKREVMLHCAFQGLGQADERAFFLACTSWNSSQGCARLNLEKMRVWRREEAEWMHAY